MRTVIVGPAPPLRGGIAKHTLALSRALEARGHCVSVTSYARLYPRIGFPGRSQREQGPHLGSPVLDTFDPRSWLEARRHVARSRADLVIVQWWHPIATFPVRALLVSRSVRVAVICHNVLPHERFPWARGLAASVLRSADFVVCHSRAVAEQVAEVAPAVGCTSVPMPMLIAPPPDLADMGDARAPAAVFLGHVRPYKGVDVLLRAWRRARLPSSATLTIAGESYLGDGRLQRWAAACTGRGVRIEDRYLTDDEIWRRLRRARVMVLPYRSGTQSGLLPLALAAGVRVIVSRVAGLAEPIAGDPRHEVVAPEDPDALARSLERMLAGREDDSPHQPSDAMRQQADSAWEVMQKSWSPTLDVLESVAATGSL